MKTTLEIPNPALASPNGASAVPTAQVVAEALDWDARIESPPRRAQGTMKVQLARCGRSRPIPASEPNTA